jgi:hypothetical protein
VQKGRCKNGCKNASSRKIGKNVNQTRQTVKIGFSSRNSYIVVSGLIHVSSVPKDLAMFIYMSENSIVA